MNPEDRLNADADEQKRIQAEFERQHPGAQVRKSAAIEFEGLRREYISEGMGWATVPARIEPAPTESKKT